MSKINDNDPLGIRTAKSGSQQLSDPLGIRGSQKKNISETGTNENAIVPQQSQRQIVQSPKQNIDAFTNNNLPAAFDFDSYSKQIVDIFKPSEVFKKAKNQAKLDDASKIVDVSGYAPASKSTDYTQKEKENIFRIDGTTKGEGYLGTLKSADGKDVTEYSIVVEIDGKEIEIPSIVPTLNDNELNLMLNDIIPNNKEIPKEIIDKSIEFYKERERAGLPAFAEKGEQINKGGLKVGIGIADKDKLEAIQAVIQENELTKIKYEKENDISKVQDVNTGEVIIPDDYEKVKINPNPIGSEAYLNFEAMKSEYRQFENNLKYFSEKYGTDAGGSIDLYCKYNEMYEAEAKKKGIDKIWDNVETQEEYDITVKEIEEFNKSFNEKFDETIRGGKDISLQNKDNKLSTIGQIDQNINYIFHNVLTGSLVGRSLLYTKSLMDAVVGKGTVGEQFRKNYKQYTVNQSRYKDIPLATEIFSIAVPLAVDILPFSTFGSNANAITNSIWKSGSNFLTKLGVKPLLSNSVALNMTNTMLKSGFNFGLTLGQYNGVMAITDELTKKKISELNKESVKNIFDQTADGFITGIAVGTISGLNSILLQNLNSKLVKSLYKIDPKTGKFIIKQGNITNKLKAVSIGGNIASTTIEGGAFTVIGASLEEDGLKNLTWEGVLEESFKFLVAMKLQPGAIKNMRKEANSPVIVDNKFTPNKAFTKGYDADFNLIELKLTGVKNKAELVEMSKDGKWLENKLSDKKIPQLTKVKLLACNGIFVKKPIDIYKSEYKEINGEHYVNSYDAKDNLVDVRKVKSKAEGKNLEVYMYNINLTTKAIKSVEGLSAESVDKINAEYEKNSRELLELNEALSISPSQRTPLQNEAIRKFNNRVEKVKQTEAKELDAIREEIKTKEKEYDKKDESGLQSSEQKGKNIVEEQSVEITGGKEAETGGDVQTPKEKEIVPKTPTEAEYEVINIDGKEYRIRENNDGTHEIRTKNDAGLDIPLRTAEGKNYEISKKVIAEYEKSKEEAIEKENEVISKEIGIPLEVITASNKAFKNSLKEEPITEAEAGKNAWITIERSEWFKNLNPEQKKEALSKISDVIERFTNSPLQPKDREKLPTEETYNLVYKGIKDRIKEVEKLIQEGAKWEAEQVEEFSATIGEMLNERVFDNASRTEIKQIIKSIKNAEKGTKSETRDKNKLKSLHRIADIINDATRKYQDKVITKKIDAFGKQISVKKDITKSKSNKLSKKSNVSQELIDVKISAIKKIRSGKNLETLEAENENAKLNPEKDIIDIISNEMAIDYLKVNQLRESFDEMLIDQRIEAIKEINTLTNKWKEWRSENIEARKVEIEKERAEHKKDVEQKSNAITRNKAAVISIAKNIFGDIILAKERYKSGGDAKTLKNDILNSIDNIIKSDDMDFLPVNKARQLFKMRNIIEGKETLSTSDIEIISKGINNLLKVPRGYIHSKYLREGGMKNMVKIKSIFGMVAEDLYSMLYTVSGNSANFNILKEAIYDKMFKGEYDARSLRVELNDMVGNIIKESFGKNKFLKNNLHIKSEKWGVKDAIVVKLGKTIPIDKQQSIEEAKQQRMVDGRIKEIDKYEHTNIFEKMSLGQLITLDFYIKNDRALNKLLGEYSESTIEAIKLKIEEAYKKYPELKIFAEKIAKDYFPKTFKLNADIYKKDTGLELLEDPNYIPQKGISNKDMFEDGLGVMYGDSVQTLSIVAPQIKSIVGGGKLDVNRDIMDIIREHTHHTSEYVSKMESIKYIKNLIGDKDFRTAIENSLKFIDFSFSRNKTKGFLNILDQWLKDYAGLPSEKKKLDTFKKIVNRAATSVLFFNISVPIKQLGSFPNAVISYKTGNKILDAPLINEMKWLYENATGYTGDYATFYKNFWKSDFIRDRLGNTMDESFASLSENMSKTKGERNAKMVRDFMMKLGGIGIKYGDVGAIIMGYKANWVQTLKSYRQSAEYKNTLKEDGIDIAENKAIDYANLETFKDASFSQQSDYIVNRGHFQRHSPLSALLPYSTTPNQYYRRLVEGYRGVKRSLSEKKAPKYEDIKKIVHYGIVQPTIYSFLTRQLLKITNPNYTYKDAINMDDLDDWKDAILYGTEKMILPLMRGNTFIERAFTSMIDELQKDAFFDYDPFQFNQYFRTAIEMTTKSITAIENINGNWTYKDLYPLVYNALYISDLGTGIGLSNISKQAYRWTNYLLDNPGEIDKLEKSYKEIEKSSVYEPNESSVYNPKEYKSSEASVYKPKK